MKKILFIIITGFIIIIYLNYHNNKEKLDRSEFYYNLIKMHTNNKIKSSIYFARIIIQNKNNDIYYNAAVSFLYKEIIKKKKYNKIKIYKKKIKTIYDKNKIYK